MNNTNRSIVSLSTRRDFLKTTGAAAAFGALSSAGPNLFAGKGINDTIGVGCIGLGTRGGDLINAIAPTPGVKVVAVCDVYKPHLQKGIERSLNPEVKPYTDYRDVLADKNVEAVVIATPDHWHCRWCWMPSRPAKTSTCEKGLAKTVAEAKRMRQAIKENTIVFYYGDNGGVLLRSKRCLQQSGTHVPLIVYFPPKWRRLAPVAPGSRIKDPVCFTDFAETVLSLAGVKIPDYMQGRAFAGPAKAAPNEFVFCTRDRMDERYDMMRSAMDRRWLYIHNYRPDLPYVQRLDYMFKARGYQSWQRMAAEGKLTPATAQFWGTKPTEELYDTTTDPDSVKNLASDPGHRETLERMRAALKRHTLEINDNGFIPEGSTLEGYDASRKAGACPIERVFALATTASERDVKKLAKLIKALDDESEPMRWWAAQGCTMLGAQAAPAEAALRKHLDDPSGAVQVAAAEALAGLGKSEAALPVLERWLQNAGTPFFALQAANVLDRLGEHARPALPAMKKFLDSLSKESGNNSARDYLMRITDRTIAVLEGREPALVYPASARLSLIK